MPQDEAVEKKKIPSDINFSGSVSFNDNPRLAGSWHLLSFKVEHVVL